MTTGKFRATAFNILVGFGDFYPRTILGKVVVVLSSIYGVCVMSLIIVSIQNSLDLTQEEGRAFLTLERLQMRAKITRVA